MSKIFEIVKPVIKASRQHAAAFADADILFDWHKIDAKRASSISGLQCIVRGTDGAAQTMVGIDLFFATSHIPTPSDGVNVSVDTEPPSLGSANAAVNRKGWFNNLIGYVPIVAGDFNDADLINLNIATKSDLDIPINGDLYVAAIAKGALDFRTTAQVNEANFAAGSQTVITFDTKAIDVLYAPGDVLHASDDAVLGTVKTIDLTTQLTLTKANEDAIENNDIIYNVSPITLVMSFESWGG